MINMDKIFDNAAVLIGELITSRAKENVSKRGLQDKGQLWDSIKPIIKKEGTQTHIDVGSNLVYAAIHEYGGTIYPDTAKNLAIPLTKEAKRALTGKNVRINQVFPDLQVIKHDEKTFLARVNDKKVELMYMLVKSSKIPARPYLRPAFYESKQAIRKLMRDTGIRGGLK